MLAKKAEEIKRYVEQIKKLEKRIEKLSKDHAGLLEALEKAKKSEINKDD